MASVLRPIGHEDRLSIVDHLDELRNRVFVCAIALGVAFAVCFWQNNALLHILNRALPHTPATSTQHGLRNIPAETVKEQHGLTQIAAGAAALAATPGVSAANQAHYQQVAAGAREAAEALPKSLSTQEKPITIGVGEPFTTTMTVAFYFALLFTLPIIIYQAYAFVLPALRPREKRAALPLMVMAPILFIIGVAFAFAIVLPPAVRFLQGYNSQNFDILVQAKTYYKFEIFTMLGVGLAFQLPLLLLALHHMGVVNGGTLTRHWRYAVVIIAIIAAALPGVDPVTTALEMVPLILLYGLSIVLLRYADRRSAAQAAADLERPDEYD